MKAQPLRRPEFCNSHERIIVQLSQSPAERVTGAKSRRFGTENLFSNESIEKTAFVTDNLYFTP